MHHRFRVLLLLTSVSLGCGTREAAQDSPAVRPGDAVSLKRTVEEYSADARRALQRDQLEDALRAAQSGLEEYPLTSDLLLTAGEACTGLGRFDEALQFYEQATDAKGVDRVVALGAAGDLHWQLGHLREAEVKWRTLLAEQPNHVVVLRRLGWLMVTEGRRWESREHLLRLVKLDTATFEDLLFLAQLDEVFDDTPHLTLCLEASPEDPFPHLGLARLDFYQEQFDEADEHLQRVFELHPDQLEARVIRGQMLAALGKMAQLPAWNQALPAGAEEHPNVWLVRGRWAEADGDEAGAIRAYLEVLQRDPNQQHACYGLSQLLARQNQPEAVDFARRAEQLDLLRRLIKETIIMRKPKPEQVEEAAQRLEDLGRIWEAWAWWGLLSREPDYPRARSERIRLRTQLEASTPQTIPLDALTQLDPAQYPLPDLGDAVVATDTVSGDTSEKSVDFRDEARSVGIDFVHASGHDPEKEGMSIYEVFGSGVVVTDFELDGWPDLYFVQSCPYPPDPRQQSLINRFYQNLDGASFREVTSGTLTADNQYGQGATSGDFNADGFPDLYVANIGRNVLYVNQGDGTFREVTAEAGLTSTRWTSSVLMADLTGDGLPDLYDACYLAGEPSSLTCLFGPDAIHRVCRPTDFPAEADEFFVNNGDGTFSADAAFSVRPDQTGRGLGILAADFSGGGRLDLFIANDMTSNFFFRNDSTSSDQAVFHEQGVVSGTAFDGRGISQACMGIAVADFDRDQDLDFHVTNYYNEFNTLYRQDATNFFSDHTAPVGLRDATLKLLAFGCQFIDAELDGWPDLVVTNGHLDDFRFEDKPYQMRPQFFHNRQGKSLLELVGPQAGTFFQGEYLGRALARIDWNGDGREDFAISHLDGPAALVTNHTPPEGNYLGLRLRGVDSNRDAIGTRVHIRCGDEQWTTQQTAGDGYYTSNQRQLLIGLGRAERVDEIRIHWPSGKEQRFQAIPVNSRHILVEGGMLRSL